MLNLQGPTATVLVAAAAHYATLWLWYSEYLFGPMWKKMGGKCAGLYKDMKINALIQFAASILIATAVCIAVSVFEKTQVTALSKEGFSQIFSWFLDKSSPNNTMLGSMKTVGFIWTGFLLPMSFSSVLWCGTSLNRWALETAGKLAGLLAIAVTVASIS